MNTSFKRAVYAFFAAIPLFFTATPAKAAGEAELLIFYGAIKLSQSQALKATANYYQAIGMGAKAQEATRLADDLANGTLGGGAGMQAFVQSNEAVERDIYELQALGAYPTARQKELAKKARQQLGTAKAALIVAIAVGTKGVLDSGGNTFQKILLGGIVAVEAGKVMSSIKRVSRAAKAYNNSQLGGSNGFQVVSAEVKPQFAQL